MDALAPDRVASSRLAVLALAGPALAVCAGAAVGCGYRPGSFRAAGAGFAGERATVGCLDVAVAGRWGGGAAPVRQAVEIDFANRCDEPVVVDFRGLRAVGRDDLGREVPLVVGDPRGEIRPLDLEARTAGREVLELTPAQARPAGSGAGPPASAARVTSACVDVAGLTGGAAAPRWLCVARPADPVAAGGAP
jgi:hypothetical protein